MEPGEPGHEGWGIADAIGKNVKQIHPGDKVTAFSYHAFAEYDLAKATQVVRLIKRLDGLPFPGDSLGYAINIFRRSQIKPGVTVAIVGIGFMGALLVQLIKNAGARVIAISRRSSAFCKSGTSIRRHISIWLMQN